MLIKTKKIFFIAVLMLLTFVCGCSVLENQDAIYIQNVLNGKYNENFVVDSIGDRLYTKHTKLYVHPANNNKLHFTVLAKEDFNNPVGNSRLLVSEMKDGYKIVYICSVL